MRLVLADCAIDYTGRLAAHLPRAKRLIVVKSDGTVLVHADVGSKALNWMSPPCLIEEGEGGWTVTGKSGECLQIMIYDVLWQETLDVGEEPGLQKTGSEHELQSLLQLHHDAIEPDLELVAREHMTDLGPVDFLFRDSSGDTVVVEVKRVAEMDAVEQLSRYMERIGRTYSTAGIRGVLVAQTFKPQTLVLAQARGISCVEVNFDVLAGRATPDLTLF